MCYKNHSQCLRFWSIGNWAIDRKLIILKYWLLNKIHLQLFGKKNKDLEIFYYEYLENILYWEYNYTNEINIK